MQDARIISQATQPGQRGAAANLSHGLHGSAVLGIHILSGCGGVCGEAAERGLGPGAVVAGCRRRQAGTHMACLPSVLALSKYSLNMVPFCSFCRDGLFLFFCRDGGLAGRSRVASFEPTGARLRPLPNVIKKCYRRKDSAAATAEDSYVAATADAPPPRNPPRPSYK